MRAHSPHRNHDTPQGGGTGGNAPEVQGQPGFPALANGPPAAVDVIHERNVSVAPNSHRERQEELLERNS